MTPRLVNKEEKRKQVRIAARGVFAKKSLSAGRIDDGAREADIGKGTVHTA